MVSSWAMMIYSMIDYTVVVVNVVGCLVCHKGVNDVTLDHNRVQVRETVRPVENRHLITGTMTVFQDLSTY